MTQVKKNTQHRFLLQSGGYLELRHGIKANGRHVVQVDCDGLFFITPGQCRAMATWLCQKADNIDERNE